MADLIKPKVPKGLFVLVLDPEMPANEVDSIDFFDGPFDGRQMVREPDGRTTFLTEGLPYTIAVQGQEKNILELDGGRVRIEPWPLSNS